MKYVRHQRIGSFQIVAHLDTGGMAEVYLALDLQDFEKLAVVKTLRENLKGEQDLVDMFRDEGRIMIGLDHPNIVHMFEFGEMNSLPYIAMEYLAGDDLGITLRASRKQAERLSATFVTQLFHQVAQGLAYVHGVVDERGQPLGLVHRDVSPQNIFLCYDGRIKLLDFGIALANDREAVTRTGLLKGKVRYMSPEQILNGQLDGRSDLFSLGVVIWEVICGQPLFKAENEFLTMKMVCERDTPLPSSKHFAVPEKLSQIVMHCLERDREQRFSNAAELVKALSEFLSSVGPEGTGNTLSQFANRVLGERRSRKANIIVSIRRESALREFLFGDLGDQLELSDSYPVATDPRATPIQLGPDPEALAAAANPLNTPSRRERLPATLGSPPTRRRSLWLPGATLLFLVLVGTVVWVDWQRRHEPTIEAPTLPHQLRLAEPPPTKSPVSNPIVAPAKPIDGQTSTTSPGTAVLAESEPFTGTRSKTVGYLWVETDPPCDAFLDKRFLGKTPVRDMELSPGSYTLILRNEEAGISRSFPVRIRAGEVFSRKFTYSSDTSRGTEE